MKSSSNYQSSNNSNQKNSYDKEFSDKQKLMEEINSNYAQEYSTKIKSNSIKSKNSNKTNVISSDNIEHKNSTIIKPDDPKSHLLKLPEQNDIIESDDLDPIEQLQKQDQIVENTTAYNNFNKFRYENTLDQYIDPMDIKGHKEDALDDLIIENSFNDYVRDSKIVEDNNDFDKYKNYVNDNQKSKFKKNAYTKINDEKKSVSDYNPPKPKINVKMKKNKQNEDFNENKTDKINENKNNSVSQKNYLINKTINDKLIEKIKELESELTKKKTRELEIKNSKKLLEEKTEFLLGANYELKKFKNELDELEKVKNEQNVLSNELNNVKQRIYEIKAESNKEILEKIEFEKNKVRFEDWEIEYKTKIINQNIEQENK